jgi:hypothetical protein
MLLFVGACCCIAHIHSNITIGVQSGKKKSGDARSYKDVMLEQQVEREKEQFRRALAKKEEEEAAAKAADAKKVFIFCLFYIICL